MSRQNRCGGHISIYVILRKKIITKIFQIDCTTNTATCDKYDIEGYPTMKIFKGGNFFEDLEYDGEGDGGKTLRMVLS